MNQERQPFDPEMMDLALDLARLNRPSPNPRVGAVVVARGHIVGRGSHERQGKPHAEVVALEDAGEDARGGDLYVTLEPCCHHGNTGPCVEEILRAGIARVAVGMVDPDSRVSGEGIRFLEQAGITVTVGLQKTKCETLLEGYTTHRTMGRPLVTLKAAITLDGYIATSEGDSKWISSEQSRVRAHEMRAEADAVLVGIETVLADDPELTVRHSPGDNPLRVVLDSSLRTPIDSQLIAGAGVSPILIVHTSGSQEAIDRFHVIDGVSLYRARATTEGRVDVSELAHELGRRGTLSLLVEGGGKVHGAFARAGIADRVAVFVAPKILGSGRPWIAFHGTSTISDGLSLCDIETHSVATDLLIKGRFSHNPDRS